MSEETKTQGPSCTVRIEQVTLRRGDYLTVWLDSADINGRDARQVELRVLADGSRELFTADDVHVSPFAGWYASETPAQLANAQQQIAELKDALAESKQHENTNGIELRKLQQAHDRLLNQARCPTCFELGKLTYVGTDAGQLAAWKKVEELIKLLDDDAEVVPADLCEQMIDFFRVAIHAEGMILELPEVKDAEENADE